MISAPMKVEVRCPKNHYLVSVPAGTPYDGYCHRCQANFAGVARG